MSTNPRTAANIANAIANQYIVDQLEAKLEATQAATSWLSQRVDELRDRVEDAENKVETARSDLAEEQGQSLSITQQQLGALNTSLVQARGDTARILSDYNRLNDALESPETLDTVSEFRNSPVIASIRQQETALQSEIDQLKQEINRIASTTEFNGRTLLDGSFTSQNFQVGANTNQTIGISIDNASGSGLGNFSYDAINDSAVAAGSGAILKVDGAVGADNGIDAQTITVAGFRGSTTAAVGASATAETIARVRAACALECPNDRSTDLRGAGADRLA